MLQRRFSIGLVGLVAATVFTGGCSIRSIDDPAPEAPPPVGAPPATPAPPEPPKPATVRIKGARSEGEFKMSGRLGLEAGALTVTIAAIRDPDAPTRPADPAKVKFGVTGAASAPLTCTIGQVSKTAKASVDLVFINDTTASMAGTVKGIADSVEKFAEDVAAGGVDAGFSMYTYGDAFATKSTSASAFAFKTGLADFDVPTFDNVARPYIGLTDLGTFKGFLGELRTSPALGSGGGDGTENTLGALDYANRKVAFRDGAARMFVAIGDNPSHQKGGRDLGPSWAPPNGDELVSSLSGEAVVHVVGKDKGEAPLYNLKGLADGTGGVFLDLPFDGRVDLGKLSLKEWLTTSFTGSCTNPTIGAYTIALRVAITGTKEYVGTLTFDVELS